jgi:SAM-dependent methyltransferase
MVGVRRVRWVPDSSDANGMSDPQTELTAMVGAYDRRTRPWHRWLSPPLPLVPNPAERKLPPATTGRCLMLGGAGQAAPARFVNVDIAPVAGVHVVADGAHLPFPDEAFAMIECDAVLEHVVRPDAVIAELQRVLQPGGLIHVVVPFNHPFHAYPHDYHRWTLTALQQDLSPLEILDAGVRTGPAATWLLYTMQFAKVLVPGTLGKALGAMLGWLLWPIRYLDYPLYRTDRAHIMANSIYVLARRPSS